MDNEDIQALAVLCKVDGHSNPQVVRNYEVTHRGKNGTYIAVVKVYDNGPEDVDGRFSVEAFNKSEPAKGTSSNSFPKIETALLTLRWWELD